MPAPKTKPAPDIADARLKALADKAAAGFPETWIATKEGDVIAGKFLRLETAATEYGIQPLIVLETEDGSERSVWLLHEALRSQFNRIRPQTGDNIAVLYLGKQKVKNKTAGRADSYHNWRVTSDKATTEAGWDILGNAPSVGNISEPDETTMEDAAGDIPF